MNERSRGRHLLHSHGTFSTSQAGGWWRLAVGGWRLVDLRGLSLIKENWGFLTTALGVGLACVPGNDTTILRRASAADGPMGRCAQGTMRGSGSGLPCHSPFGHPWVRSAAEGPHRQGGVSLTKAHPRPLKRGGALAPAPSGSTAGIAELRPGPGGNHQTP